MSFVRSNAAHPEPIAIVGIACRFPRASTPEAFWRLLHDGVDAITEVPPDRWDIDAYYDPDLTEPGKTNSRWGGFIENATEFDPAFFGISQGEAKAMDPQHRLLLEVSWEALEDAGLPPALLAGSATGVFVGISGGDYARACFADYGNLNAYYAAGNALCFASNRVSKYLNLRGPSISLDTGCSASLFALHLACQSLRTRETDLAIAGGVNLILSPAGAIALSQAWLMAADGRCKSFDAAADGYVRGEGCGMVVLRRLSDALERGDKIWGIIKGMAVNQDGHGGNLTTPDPAAQEAVVRQALRDACLAPEEIDYIEAHGVGTKAADLAEARALHRVFGNVPAYVGTRPLGSVKTNIGHLETGAGMAALIKVLLALRHERIPKTLHFKSLHPDIAASGIHLDIATESVPWARSENHIRRAGINSFGLGGANGHLVLEEPPLRTVEPSHRALHLLTLSAKSRLALQTIAVHYAEHIAAHPEESFADLCFTANTGRTHFNHRLALVSGSAEEACAMLTAFASGTNVSGIQTGVVKATPSTETESSLSALPSSTPEQLRIALEQLAASYIRGEPIDWAVLEQNHTRQKLSLPTYPFERRRCWIQDKPEPRAADIVIEHAPLLERMLQNVPLARRRNVLEEFVASEASAVIGVEFATLGRDRGFAEMGMTSLMAVELLRRLQVALGRMHVLPATIIFEYPTILAFCDYLSRNAFAHLMPAEVAAPRTTAVVPAGFGASNEPIAIVGMACRFPGDANDPETFFQQLCAGIDAITAVPPDRWNADAYYHPDPEAPGKSYSRAGGFLRDVKHFDAEFFGISPREAASMDPQQRLALEVSWEAVENAGVTREQLTGSLTGVYFGAIGSEYQQLRMKRMDLRAIDAYFGTGVLSSAISGRIAHFLGLQGPTLTVDAACSSSMVAVHLACQSLRSGECRLAIAGGVNVMLLPESTIFGCRVRALATDDRCKTFDASANGYVRSEGAGAVALKRLSDAVADNDEVLAVILGSAVHHDGPSSGFTVPNGSSQQALIRHALANAGVQPAKIQYVEAHGTGTSLGDPIEARALGAVFSEGRAANDPFLLGSVKTNIGHLEAAAGIAGLVKVVLSLRHEQIPPHLHFHQQNPRISPQEVPALIPTQVTPWPAGTRRRIAGVSSFGLSGTIAHAIVAEAPPKTSGLSPEQLANSHILTLSAHTHQALLAHARAYLKFLSVEGSLRDICYSASVRRSHHEHRLAVVGSSHREMAERLEAFLAGEARPGLSFGSISRKNTRRVVFVCPGQGSQWIGMGQQLLRQEPVFQEAIASCAAAMRPHTNWSLLEMLESNPSDGRFEAIDVIQPVLFAIQVALAALWSSWGIRPDALIGHSMGEVAAAHIAGVLSLEDAARIICRRSALLRQLSGKGAMAVVDLPLDETRTRLAGREDRLAIAVSNSPRSTVISGDPAAIQEVLAQLERDGTFCRLVKVDVASHSPQVDPILDELRGALSGIAPRAATIPLYSTVTDKPIFDAAYWVRNLRDPVLFFAAVKRALDEGCDIFVEISPHPILLPAIEQVLTHAGANGIVIPSLRREEDECNQMLSALGALHVAGYPVNFSRVYHSGGQLVPLPSYPFQRERHWFEEDGQETASEMPTGRRRAHTHPVLGERITLSSAPELCIWETEISVEALPYIEDHLVQGTPVLPGMAYIAMALTAANEVFGEGPCVLADIEFHRALFLPEHTTRILQTTLVPSGDGHARFLVHSRPSRKTNNSGDDDWLLHMNARVEPAANTPPERLDVAGIKQRCTAPIGVTDFYKSLDALGNHFGPRHQGVQEIQRGAHEAWGRSHLPQSLEHEARAYFIHPAFLDACCQVGLAAIPRPDEPQEAIGPLGVTGVFMPSRIDRLIVHARPGADVRTYAHFVPQAGPDMHQNLVLFDSEGRTLMEMSGAQGRYLERSTENALPTNLEDWLYEIAWRHRERTENAPTEPTDSSRKWLIFADSNGTGEALAALLAERGEASILVSPSQTYARFDSNRFSIRPSEAADMAQLLTEAFVQNGSSVHGVVHFWSLDTTGEGLSPASLRAAQTLVSTSVVRLIQALREHQNQGPAPRCWFVTRGVAMLGDDVPAEALARAPLWGFGRTIVEEHPEFWGGFIDLCPTTVDCALQARWITADIRQSDGEDLLAFRNGQRHVARLVRRPRTERKKRPLRLRTDGTYLLTGGLGGIGLAAARWLIDEGARRLILMGRTPLPPRAEWANLAADNPFFEQIAAIRALESLGATVHLAAADVSDKASLKAFLTSFKREAWPPIRGVIHAAAVVHERAIAQLDEATIMADLAPKLVGGHLLHHLLEDAPLDFFVLFSSGSTILGSPFLGAYAAANAALDALAHYRKTLGRPATSIDWGFWAEVGLTAQRQKDTGRTAAPQGIGSFTPAQAFSVMKLLLEDDAIQTFVMPMHWQQWARFHTHSARAPLYSELIQEHSTHEKSANEEPALRQELLGIEPGWRRRAKLETYLQQQIGMVLRLSPSKVSVDRPLGTFGLDSLMGLELRRRFETSTGLILPATLVWTYPTVTDLATHLASRMEIPLDAEVLPSPALTAPTETASEPDELSEEDAAAMLADVLAMVRERKTT